MQIPETPDFLGRFPRFIVQFIRAKIGEYWVSSRNLSWTQTMTKGIWPIVPLRNIHSLANCGINVHKMIKMEDDEGDK